MRFSHDVVTINGKEFRVQRLIALKKLLEIQVKEGVKFHFSVVKKEVNLYGSAETVIKKLERYIKYGRAKEIEKSSEN